MSHERDDDAGLGGFDANAHAFGPHIGHFAVAPGCPLCDAGSRVSGTVLNGATYVVERDATDGEKSR